MISSFCKNIRWNYNSDLNLPNLIIYKWHLLTIFDFFDEINKYIEHKNGNTRNVSYMTLINSRIQFNINNSHFGSESIGLKKNSENQV